MDQMNTSLEELLRTSFRGNIVGKNLTQKAGLNYLPRYVAEFILGNYLDRFEDPDIAIKEAKAFVTTHYPENNSGELLKHKLLEEGEIKILQKYDVTVNLKKEEYYATTPILHEKIHVDPNYTSYYPALLTTGMWGLGHLYYIPSDQSDYKMELVDFKPFQLGSFDRDEFFTSRLNFSLTQWIDLLITSLGLNAHYLSDKQKLLIIARLIPLVSQNLNIAEFGPKSTGKTYQYRNHSSYTHVVSGSSITPAKLIFDLRNHQAGLISTSDVIAFDEVTGADFGDKKDFELIGLLKDYMEGGNVSRGIFEVNEDASLVFLGNIEIRGEKPKFNDFVRELPAAFSDSAFIDRIHGIIPGWEIPKIAQTEVAFTTETGLISNYIGEAFHNLRSWDHPSLNWKQINLDLKYYRNENAVRKLTNGLLKLLFPGVTATSEEINLCLGLACELRQVVYDQLSALEPDEFGRHRLSARIR